MRNFLQHASVLKIKQVKNRSDYFSVKLVAIEDVRTEILQR